MKNLHVCLLLVALAGGCTDFTDLPRNQCGNGLLEPGEDCDNEAANCVRCAVTCGGAGDCPTDAYACGTDGFCHAPGGQLADPSAPVTFQADDLRVTDIDRDGAGDVIGVSKTSIIVRKGDVAGTLSATTSFVTPAQSGPPAFGDLDGDQTIDVTLSTPDGIVSYTSRFGTLSPVAIESPLFAEDGSPLNFLRLFQVTTFELGGVIEAGGFASLIVVTFADPPKTFGALPCEARVGPLAPNDIQQSSVDIYRVSADGALNTELIVSFLTANGTPCVTSIHGNAVGGYAFDDITPAGANGMVQKPILADLDTDNDRCPNLINSDGGGGALRMWSGRTLNGHCVLDPDGADGALIPGFQQGPQSAVAIGRIELLPQIPGFARDSLVLTSGVYAHVPVAVPILELPQGVFEIYSSNGRNLAFVATGDLDNDGDVDAVLATADQDDLDVLFRFPGGLQLLRIDTASQVSSLTLGDFDGNGIRDIAYTETEGDHHDLMIAYGTTDRPLDPVQVATFSGVGSVSVLQFPDSVDTLAIAEDLAIIQPGAGIDGGSLMSLLHGSPQRTMLSFFDPRTEALREGAQATVLRGAVIGDFTDATVATHRDLIAFGAPVPGSSSGMRAWRVAGTEFGLDNQPNDGVIANGLADCTGTGVCVANAELLAFPISEGHDVVLAIDRASPPHIAVLDPFASTTSLSKSDAIVLDGVIPEGTVVRSLYAVNVDDDPELELVASFASDTDGEVIVCEMSTGGGAFAVGVPDNCAQMTKKVREIAPDVTACIDAAPITLYNGALGEDTPGKDLVLLCREGETTSLFKMSNVVARTTGATVVSLEARANGMQRIRAGDVTGDGVDDVIAVVGTGGSQSLIVFRQCDSRELGACQKTVGNEARGEAP